MSTLNKTHYFTDDELLEVAKKDKIPLESKLIERIKNGEEKAFCLVAERYYHNKDHLKAMIWFLKSAYFQNSAAQYYIGRIFETGTDAMINKRQALEWYQRSADQGYPLAITRTIKLRWKGYHLDSNQKTFINLERKSEELKRGYLDKVESLEQRYQASLKLLDYEKLSLELDERRSIANETDQAKTTLEYSNSKIEELENQFRLKLETLEQKNQVLEDEIKFLERENVLNQEAFEKEKMAVRDLIPAVTSEVEKRWEEERTKLNEKLITMEEEHKASMNEALDKIKTMEDNLAVLELEVVKKQELEERLKSLESNYARSVTIQDGSIDDHVSDQDPTSRSSNNQDVNKIRVMVEYNVTSQT